MNEVFVGLDLSLASSGVITYNHEKGIIIKKLIITKPTSSMEERFEIILKEVDFIKTLENRQGVYIEGLSHGSVSSKKAELAAAHYIVRYNLYQSNILFKVIPPNSLKKFATGKGQVKKNLMLLHCYKKFGEEFESDDLCDAYLLTRMAHQEYTDSLETDK